MSINDVLPEYIERKARKLLDDDHFVEAIWGAAVFYYDLRQVERPSKTVAEQRERLRAHAKVARQYRKALRADARIDLLTGERMNAAALSQVERDIDEVTQALSRLEGMNSSKANRTLQMLAKQMLEIFRAHGVSERKVAGFIEDTIGLYTPSKTNPPSRPSIDNALKNYK